jgi:hypothetical protein
LVPSVPYPFDLSLLLTVFCWPSICKACSFGLYVWKHSNDV